MAKKKELKTVTSDDFVFNGDVVITPSNEGITFNLDNISEITTDFGRADLNEVVAKLNEVIRKING